MNIIKKISHKDGSFPPIQSWNHDYIPEGYAKIDESLNTAVFYEYNGFVFLTIEEDVVTEIVPNTEAWEAWKAEQPEPNPEPESTEPATYDEMANAIQEGVNDV